MPAGRPIEYCDAILKLADQYVIACEDELRSIVSGESEKFTTYKEKIRVNLPTIEGLAVHLGIHKDTIYDWEKKYPEFSDVINVLRGKQARELINKGLSGDYNPIIAKLLLMKHGYTDKSEIDQTVKGDWTISMNINGGNKVRKALDAGISDPDN